MMIFIGLGFIGVGLCGFLIHRSLLRVGISAYFSLLGVACLMLSSPLAQEGGEKARDAHLDGQVLALMTIFFGTMICGGFAALALRLFGLSGKEDPSLLDSLRH